MYSPPDYSPDEPGSLSWFLTRIICDPDGWLSRLPIADRSAAKAALIRDATRLIPDRVEALTDALTAATLRVAEAAHELESLPEALPEPLPEALPAVDRAGRVRLRSECMRLRSACIAYARARRFPVADALMSMWTDDSPLEPVETLETLFRTLCYDDSLTTAVFCSLRAPDCRT